MGQSSWERGHLARVLGVRKGYPPPGVLKRIGAILVIAPLICRRVSLAGAGFGLIWRAGFRNFHTVGVGSLVVSKIKEVRYV